jgi:hypothetical protein
MEASSDGEWEALTWIASDEWLNGPWKTLSPRIRFLQCLGIYWMGYPAEKEKAKEYLIQFSGQKADSPATYLKWYRKACLGLPY